MSTMNCGILALLLLAPACMTLSLNSWKFAYYHQDLASAVIGMHLTRQVSHSPCTAGTSYGYEGNTVWVDAGCRGEFEVMTEGDLHVEGKSLSSNNWAYYSESLEREVLAMELSRQVSRSPCTAGDSFGFQGTLVWVDNGCRAEFNLIQSKLKGTGYTSISETVSLDSWKYARYEEHVASYILAMTLTQQNSNSDCTEAESYGFSDTEVWVDNGCRGDFTITRLHYVDSIM